MAVVWKQNEQLTRSIIDTMKQHTLKLYLCITMLIITMSAHADFVYYYDASRKPFVCSDYDYQPNIRIVDDFFSTSSMQVFTHEYAYKPTSSASVVAFSIPNFFTTSSMSGSESMYASTPVNKSNGEAVCCAYTIQRRVRLMTNETLEDDDERQGGTPPTYIVDVDPVPVGDAMSILMVLAVIYGIGVYFRRKSIRTDE